MRSHTENITIVNKLGLHARAAAKFVKLASEFKAEVSLSRNGETVNGKSIMGILMLAAGKGTHVLLTVRGDSDVDDAFQALKKLIQDGFGEKQ
jgi:phosphocarrier protein HPr